MPHRWHQREEQCPIDGISGRNGAPIDGTRGRNDAPIDGISGRNGACKDRDVLGLPCYPSPCMCLDLWEGSFAESK